MVNFGGGLSWEEPLQKNKRGVSFGEGGGNCKILLTSEKTNFPLWNMEVFPGSIKSKSGPMELLGEDPERE